MSKELDAIAAGQAAMLDTLDLGDAHVLTFVSYDANRIGATIAHKKPDGSDCGGWLPFAGRAFAPGEIAAWTVECDEPLTLSPSVLCRICGDHGFVRNGRWIRA